MPHPKSLLAPLVALLPLMLVGCDPDSPPDRTVAAASIGPAGGEIEVSEGQYAGLKLSVPPGALASTVTIRCLAPERTGLTNAVTSRSFGPYVEIQPHGLTFAVPATLRLPYYPDLLRQFTGPGNVRAMHFGGPSRYIEPPVVDASAGRLEVLIPGLGGFEPAPGEVVQGIDAYFPVSGSVVPLENGATFTYEAVVEPRFRGGSAVRWGLWDGMLAQNFFVRGYQVAGREVSNADWQEVWDTPLDWLVPEWNTLTPPAVTTTRIHSPINNATPVFTGQAQLLGRYGFEIPLRIGSREFRDVLRVQFVTSWDRPDLGSGSLTDIFWFAPGVGLLQWQSGETIRIRTDL